MVLCQNFHIKQEIEQKQYKKALSAYLGAFFDFIDYFKEDNTVVFVDPAMADNEKLYQGLKTEYVKAIKRLCQKADIIAPNIYEAMFLCDDECKKEHTYDEALKMLKPLSMMCDKIIITYHSNE